MAKVLHIKDAYFELPDKYNNDIGCMGSSNGTCTPVMEIWMWQSQGIVMVIMNHS